MKKVRVLLSLILVVVFCIIGSNEVKAYTTIDSQYLFTPSTFDTLILNYTSLPTLSVSGSERYTISDGACSSGEPIRRIDFPDSYRGKTLNSTITVDFKSCGTLNGKPINMKLIYSDIITSNSGSYLYWSAFGSVMKSTNEWWYSNVEHLKIDVYFYYTDSNTPINIDTAYLSIFSEDQNEGASSSTSKEEYLYTTTHMAYAQTLQSYTGRVFNNVYYGTADGNTEAGSLNCVAFRYGSTDHLQVELYGLNQKTGIGYHLQYTPLTATLPSDPVKSVDKAETELGDTLIYTIEQKISERFDDDFHYSSLVFKDTIDSNLTYNSLKVYNENGADITASAGTVGYNSQTRQLTYTFNSNYLNNMAYNGQVYKFEINTKVNNNSTSATVTDKASTTINNLHVLESNTVTSTLKSKVVVHYVNKQGVKIADDVVINGNYLDPYETQEKDIYAYELVDVSGDTTGTMNKNTIEVTYVYDLIRVNINLTKTLEATDSSDAQNLEGARFKLTVNNFAEQVEYANPDREYFSTYTDKNGNCVILGVPFGNYTIVEEVVPDLAYAGNFYLNGSTDVINNFTIDINSEQELSYSIEDVAKKMQITIYKEDIETGATTQGDAHLEGAKYTIYKDADCTDEVETIAIQKNEDGTYSATSGWYLSGTYYVKETEAPEGYLLDENVYTVSQDPASQTEEYSYHTVTSKDEVKRNSIEIVKNLEETDSTEKQSLAGAVFSATLNSDTSKVYYSTETDANGYCIIEDLPYGTYTLRESTVPDIAYNGEFYIEDSQERVTTFEQFIELDSSESESYKYEDITDVAKKMQITIYKEDIETGATTQGDAHLEGAKYTIYKDADCTDEVETIAIQKNEDGTYSATSGWYLSGTYYVKETEAPEGYLLDENVYTVSQDPASQTEEYSYHTITSKDEVIKGSINVIKYNNESDSTQDSPAEGAVLRLTLNSNPDKYYEATVDENGYLEFIDDDYKDEYPYTIPYGKYTISEVKASNSGEHIFIDKQQTEITYDRQVQKYILNDEYVRMKLSIEIRDSETSKLIPGGATFKIWDADNQKWYEEMSFPSGEYISEFTTNDKGQLTFNRHLEAGNYVIYEIKAPEGYYLDDNLREGAKGYEFTVGVAENGDVKVYHDGTEEVLAYEEVIYDNTPTKMYSYTATLYNTPQKAVVNIEKLAEQFIRADRTNTEYGYLNTPVYELRGLEDVSFRLVAAEDITTPEGTIRYTKGQVVSNDITDKDGLANTSEVYLGKYVLEEVSTPNGYIISSQPVNLDIVYTNQYEKVQYVDTQLENERQDVNLSFKKEFKELENSRFKIEGQEAIFGIYTRNSLKNYNDENVLGQDELVDIMVMDDNNNVASNVNLPEGTYYVKELYVSNPYEKSNEQYDFSVEFINSEDRTLSLTVNDGVITNVADVAEFELIVFPDTVWNELDIENEFDRKDLEDLAEVFGVADKTYGVYSDEECTKPVMTIDDKEATFVTNEDGIINVPDMPTGTYYLKEIIAPYGYELSDEVIKVEINEDDNFVLLKAKEPLKKASLLQKIDSFTKDVLAGVKFEITDENDELVYTGVTNEEGIVEIPIIYFENGQEYYYKEISAPDMYNINDEKQKFTAKYDEEKCEWTLDIITVENERKTIDEVIVRKTDADTGNPLQGCVFTIVLLDENGQEYINKNGEKIYLVKDVVTNENGEYVINNVPYGTYKFVEITPPEGYEMDEDITGLTFTIDENSPDTVIFEVTNTGDIAVIAIACVAVVCIIGIVFVIVKKKKESK